MYTKWLRFDPGQISSWSGFVQLLNRPCDSSLLGYLRIAFGLLMVIDIPQERGMSIADKSFSLTAEDCNFPYFSFIKPLSLDSMMIVYLALFVAAVGIMLGFMYRMSCLVFVLCYWYIFLLNKTHWNNHSYLYGVLSVYFLLVDGNRYASIDGLLNKKIRNTQVPMWTYTLIRFQIFIVYFIAGLKKTDMDWLQGYSMTRLSKHWVFDPLKIFFDEEFLDLFVVHKFGFLLDLTIGFWLFWDKTRKFAFVFCGSFNLMNSQIFSIGMFPYSMLATMFVFCKADSFKKLISRLPSCLQLFETSPCEINPNCYVKSQAASLSYRQVFSAFMVILWISEQLFLPFSHFITLGYNGWTEGPYGYSWDMMVQNTATQHIKITYVDKYGEEGFLQPRAFLKSRKDRWSLHPDHAVQYAKCLKERLMERGIEEPKIYFDVWKSLNKRFIQRIFDPHVDIATYDWSPFHKSTFMQPMMWELSGWREKLKEIKKDYKKINTTTVFIADFPGLSLENYVEYNHSRVTIELLQGEITVDYVTSVDDVGGEVRTNVTLKSPGDKIQVPAKHFHYVHTVSKEPSCYFYSYPYPEDDKSESVAKKSRKRPESFKEKFLDFAFTKYLTIRRSYLLLKYAFKHKLQGMPASIEEYVKEQEDINYWLKKAGQEKKWIEEYSNFAAPTTSTNNQETTSNQASGRHSEL